MRVGILAACVLFPVSLPVLCEAQKNDALPPPQNAVTVVKPERGFVDDAFALSADGTIFYYINTDGASFANLRAIGLPPPAHAAASPAPAAASAPAAVKDAAYPPLRLGATASKASAHGQQVQRPIPAPAQPLTPAVALAPGASLDVISGLPLSIIRMALLPDDRVLLVMRDLETGGAVMGSVYSLRSRTQVPLPGVEGGNIGPVTDIVLGESPTGPVLVSFTRAPDGKGEYQVKEWSATTLQKLGQRGFGGNEDRMTTPQGSARLLYFIDDYQTVVAKHDGFYDKKKDFRQPDFLAFIDALTGKLRRSQTIIDPSGLLELTRLHKDHSESVFPLANAETQKIELFAVSDRPSADVNVQAEVRSEIRLPRSSTLYDGATLRYQKLRRDRLMLSLTVDPVNEQAVAARRSDPDDIDFCLVDPTASAGGAVTAKKLRTIPGHKRPSLWVATVSGRTALLRKHKNFPRGGTEVEVYDLDLEGTSP